MPKIGARPHRLDFRLEDHELDTLKEAQRILGARTYAQTLRLALADVVARYRTPRLPGLAEASQIAKEMQ